MALFILFVLVLFAHVGRASTVHPTFPRGAVPLDRRAVTNGAGSEAIVSIDDADTAVAYMCAAPGTCTGVWNADTTNGTLHSTTGPDTSLSITFTGIYGVMLLL